MDSSIDTLLEACKSGCLTRVKKFIAQGCDPTESNQYGITPLHQACGSGQLAVVQYLVEELYMDIETCKDQDGMTPLHHSCWKGILDVLKYLIEERGCDPNVIDSNGWTPLHHGCGWGHLEVARYLIEVAHCNPSIVDKDERAPLDYCCRWGHFEVAKYLIESRYNSVDIAAADSMTPFHSCCCAIIPSPTLMEYLLREAKCDPNKATSKGFTPLSIASMDQSTVRLLLAYGAKPPYEDWNKYLQHSESTQPVQPRAKLALLGDPEGGKTTLIKSIETESGGFVSSVVNYLFKVPESNFRTVGIIPHEVDSKQLGRLTIYDMAGHPEFYASHDAALRNVLAGSACIITLVADISRGVEYLITTVNHWIHFSENLFNSGHKPFLLIIGSHSDLVSAQNFADCQTALEKLKLDGKFLNFHYRGFLALDCRYAVSNEMTTLRSLILKCCDNLRQEEIISFREHCFYVWVMDQFADTPAISIADLLERREIFLDGAHVDHAVYIPRDVTAIFKICEELNKRGNILFFPNREHPKQSWVVLNKHFLLNRIDGTLFAPKQFEQHCDFASNTGIVPSTRLREHFPDLDHDLVISFMSHLQFCHEIVDRDILEQLLPKLPVSSSERFLFFPAFVQITVPDDIWDTHTEFAYESVWLLSCTDFDHFFTSRFSHITILRLAVQFAMAANASLDDNLSVHVRRMCKVWKNGISWRTRSGVDVIVEIADNVVTLYIRARKNCELAALRIRSSVISKILAAKSDILPKTDVTEFLVSPRCISYPLESEVTQICITQVAQSIVSRDRFCYDETWNTEELSHLLYFEPFMDFGESILKALFSQGDTNVEDQFLAEIANRAYCNTEHFINIFDTSAISLENLLHQSPPGEAYKLLQVFKLCKQHHPTYSDLCLKLCEYSVFAGRNPLLFSI